MLGSPPQEFHRMAEDPRQRSSRMALREDEEAGLLLLKLQYRALNHYQHSFRAMFEAYATIAVLGIWDQHHWSLLRHLQYLGGSFGESRVSGLQLPSLGLLFCCVLEPSTSRV